MKMFLLRLLPVALLLGLAACQNTSTSSTETDRTDGIPLALRLSSSTGDSIPAADSLHFYVKVSGRDHVLDTTVCWKRHELDLGTVGSGATVTWKISALRVTDTTRVVVWASDTLHALASASGDQQRMTLETPVAATDITAPSIASLSATPDASRRIALAYADSAYAFSFTLAETLKTTVTRSDTAWASSGKGRYATTVRVAAGKSATMRVSISDSVGNAITRTWTFVRAVAGAVDSTIRDTIVSPDGGSEVAWADSQAIVTVHVHSVVKADSVLVLGTKLDRAGSDTVWSGKVVLAVGENALQAIAWAGKRSASSPNVTVTRKTKFATPVDSSVAVNFLVPTKDTTVPNATSLLGVTVKTTSLLSVDSVLLNGKIMSVGTGGWSRDVSSLKVGDTILIATAWAAGKARGSDTVKVTHTPLSRDDSLKSISTTNGSFSPSFTKKDSVYVLTLATGKDTVTLTPSVSESHAIVTASRADGKALSWPLTVTDTVTVHFNVTAQDGINKMTYTIRVVSVPVAIPSVSLINPTGDTSVPYSTDRLTFKASVSSPHLKSVTIGGKSAAYSNGLWIATVSGFSVGVNAVKVVAVDSTGGADSSKLWKVTRRETSATMELVSLGTSVGTLYPALATGVYVYSDSVPYGNTAETFSPTLPTGVSVTCDGESCGAMDLADTARTVRVVTFKGTDSLVYLVTLPPKKVPLKYLVADRGNLLPAFNKMRLAYSDTLIYGTRTITLTPTLTDAQATLTINGGTNDTINLDSIKTGGTKVVTIMLQKLGFAPVVYTVTLVVKSQIDVPWNKDPSISYGSFTDSRDGRIYRTVDIGAQTWMAENLEYNAAGSFCYASSLDSCTKYGRLYTWATAMGASSTYNSEHLNSTVPVQGVCPSDWHVPSDAEWQTMEVAVGMTSAAAAKEGERGTIEGTKLKALGGWGSTGNGSDIYGFRTLPSGVVLGSPSGSAGNYADFWSASESGSSSAWYRYFYSRSASVGRGSYISISYGEANGSKTYAFSLRCLHN